MIGYKYRTGRGPRSANGDCIFERDIEALSQNKIFIPTVSELNDPSEGLFDAGIFWRQLEFVSRLASKQSAENVKKSFDAFVEKLKSAGIYSLSYNPLSELMWAYYANGHNGYAIVFDTDILYKSLNGGSWFSGIYEFDVKYSNKFPSVDLSVLNKIDASDFLIPFIGRKSKVWEHEKEHRLIFDKGGECKHIDYRAIKGFVFGTLMTDSDILYVMDKFKGRGLSYKKVELISNTYKLRLVEIEDRFADAPKYVPNNVQYDFDALLEFDRCSFGAALLHKAEAKQALDIVCREPFVTGVYLLFVTEDESDKNKLNITVGADYDNPALVQIKKVFRFIVDDNHNVVMVE